MIKHQALAFNNRAKCELNGTRIPERPRSPTVTLTWHAGKYRVDNFHHSRILCFSFLSLVLCQIAPKQNNNNNKIL